MAVKHQQEIAMLLGSKAVSYSPALSEMLGSINDSIFLNQMLYWYDQGKDHDWIFKTVKEFQKETGLKVSIGKISRAFWVSLAVDPSLRKEFIDRVCKISLEEAANKNKKYY